MIQRMTITEYLDIKNYTQRSRPTRKTIISRIRKGLIPAEFEGKWYVLVDEEDKPTITGNPIADSILAKINARS